MSISKEDYTEPVCPLCMHPEIKPIPIARVIEKLDAFLGKNDYSSAERLLKYWLNEADVNNDSHGKLSILNEMIGLYRKINKETECIDSIYKALALSETMGIEQSVSYGTTLINAATGFKAFDKPEEALPLYRKAKKLYEANLEKNDERYCGLYNNMAITLTGLKQYREAEELFNKAVNIMLLKKAVMPEVAITYLNLADLIAAEYGLEEGAEKIEQYLSAAEHILKSNDLVQNGNYAYVCEKCAPVFGYYGYFVTEQELNDRARKIYEGN